MERRAMTYGGNNYALRINIIVNIILLSLLIDLGLKNICFFNKYLLKVIK